MKGATLSNALRRRHESNEDAVAKEPKGDTQAVRPFLTATKAGAQLHGDCLDGVVRRHLVALEHRDLEPGPEGIQIRYLRRSNWLDDKVDVSGACDQRQT